jgi:hypothetical protein
MADKSKTGKTPVEPSPPQFDQVLRRMLETPPDPHAGSKKPARKAVKKTKGAAR